MCSELELPLSKVSITALHMEWGTAQRVDDVSSVTSHLPRSDFLLEASQKVPEAQCIKQDSLDRQGCL